MPTNAQIKEALKAALGDKVVFVKGSATRGRSWDEHPTGLSAHIFHHTANPNAKGSTGAPSLNWCINANGQRPFANAVIGRDGTYYVLSLGSCWHSGYGGPWPSRGFKRAGDNTSARAFWGVEIDDPGRSNTITKAQIASAAKAAAALGDLCKWDEWAFITHGDWTDAGSYLRNKDGKQEGPAGPYKGRKIDTLRQYYSGEFWRAEVKKYRKPVKPVLPVLDVSDMRRIARNWDRDDRVVVLTKALKKVGMPVEVGDKFTSSVKRGYRIWQRRIGADNTSGLPHWQDMKELAKQSELFTIVA